MLFNIVKIIKIHISQYIVHIWYNSITTQIPETQVKENNKTRPIIKKNFNLLQYMYLNPAQVQYSSLHSPLDSPDIPILQVWWRLNQS